MKTNQEMISKELNVSADDTWRVISAVGGVEKWFSSLIKTCSVEDGKRFCRTTDGIEFEEDILEINHDTKTFVFAIPEQNMLPVQNIVETMVVRPTGDNTSIVDWSASFDTTEENAAIAKEALRNLWVTGLEEMEQFIVSQN